MRNISPILWVMSILFMLLSTSAAAAQTTTVLIAAVEGDSVYVARIGDDRTQERTVFMDGGQIGNIAWDPQLLWFIFTYDNADGQIVLAMSDNMYSPAVTVVEGIAPLPPSFSASGNELVYAVEADEGKMDVYVMVREGFHGFVEPSRIATIPYDMDCGGEGVDAPQIALAKEYGVSGDYSQPKQILFLSPDGLIHNEGCAAQQTLVTNLETGQTTEIGHNLQWATPSRDGMLVAGISEGELVIATTDGSFYKVQPTSAPPSYPIAWGDEDHPNALFYTSRERNGRLSLDAADEQLIVSMAGEDVLDLWNVSIYEYDIAAYTDRQVYSGAAYGIGSIRMVMGNGLVFSEVVALETWINHLLRGATADATNDRTIGVNLYHLNLNTGGRALVGNNIRQSRASWNAAAG